MKHVIALIGEQGSGKGTVTEIIKKHFGADRVSVCKSSGPLIETLTVWGLEISRENLQKLPMAMQEAFGEGLLTKALEARINALKGDIVIFDSIRLQSDYHMIRGFSGNLVLYVTANQQIRFERLQNRREKTNEQNLTFGDFLKHDTAETEVLIPRLGAKADFLIRNETGLKELEEEVRRILNLWLMHH